MSNWSEEELKEAWEHHSRQYKERQEKLDKEFDKMPDPGSKDDAYDRHNAFFDSLQPGDILHGKSTGAPWEILMIRGNTVVAEYKGKLGSDGEIKVWNKYSLMGWSKMPKAPHAKIDVTHDNTEYIDVSNRVFSSPARSENPMGYWENRKPTNPKDLVGVRKVPLSVLSCAVLMEVALGLMEGGCKYGRHNYRDAGVAFSIYYDATMRHLMSWWEGEDMDPDSGLSHITKAISSLFVLRDAMINKKFTDDRPIKVINPDWMQQANEGASMIADKYPNPKKPYTQIPLPE